MEGVDVSGVVVAGEGVDTLAHLGGRLVGEGDAEDVSRQDARFLHQKSEAAGQRPGLTRASSGNDPEYSFCGGHRLPLGLIEPCQQIMHVYPPPPQAAAAVPVSHSFYSLHA